MMRRTSIGSDGAAYRRGVVLGLTMAEIMLLLIFCLLIAASVIFNRDRKKNLRQADQLRLQQTELDHVKEDAKALTSVLNEVRRPGQTQQQIEENWRELVQARTLVEKLKSAGVDADDVARNADQLKKVVAAMDQGATGQALDADWRQAEELRKTQAASGGKGEHNWPPIISLSDAKGYSFSIGSAGLTPDFEKKIKSTVVDQVANIVKAYEVDIVEVIGHTDEQPVNGRASNLDGKLIPALSGNFSIDGLNPADNAGLGMARAVSVARILKADARLAGIRVLPLSGGQMILPGDTLTSGTDKGEAKERRRIEIRMRRAEKPAVP